MKSYVVVGVVALFSGLAGGVGALSYKELSQAPLPEACQKEVRYAEKLLVSHLNLNGGADFLDLVPHDHPDLDLIHEIYQFSFNYELDDFVPAVRERCRTREEIRQRYN